MNSKEEKRIQIIEAAMKVFGKYGFHKSKIEEIAKVAEVGKGTIYEYFNSKKDLFEQMIEYIIDAYLQITSKSMNTAKTVEEKLIIFAKNHGFFVKNYMDIVENIMAGSSFLSEEIRHRIIEKQEEVFTLICNTLEMGIKTGELKKDINTNIASLGILGSINQIYTVKIYFKKMDPEDIDPVPIINTIFNGLR